MISLEKGSAKHFLRHLAIAAKKTQKKSVPKVKKASYEPTEHEKKRIKSLERKLAELNKVEKSFELLKQRISEYTTIKKEEEIALDEIKKIPVKKVKHPIKKKVKPKSDIKQLEFKLKVLETKFQQLKKKGYSETDLKKARDLIGKLKFKINKIQ